MSARTEQILEQKRKEAKVRKIYKEIFSGLASVAVIEIVLYVIFYYAFFIQ